MENSNMNGMLTRKERVMKQEAELRLTLQQNFSTLEKEKSALQSEIIAIQKRLSTVEESLVHETMLRERSDIEYTTLRDQVNQASDRSRQDLQALRAGIQTLKKGRKDDARTMQLMAAEIDRLSLGYAKERDIAREVADEVAKVKEKQKEQIERALRGLRKELEKQLEGNQENLSRTGEALAELRALNGKIRAVDPDLH
jgi:predicted  nucleic acid-binding Zn-ribbon protein